MHGREIIFSLACSYPPKKKISLLEYGDSGTCAISNSTAKCFIPTLLTSGKLNSYLADIDEQADDLFFRLVNQMVEREGVTEQLKMENQMEWVGRMNNIHGSAMEIVNAELIYS